MSSLSSHHGQVGHGVGGRVGPAALGAQSDAPRQLLERGVLTRSMVVLICAVVVLGVQAIPRLADRLAPPEQAAGHGDQANHDEAPDKLGHGELPAQ